MAPVLQCEIQAVRYILATPPLLSPLRYPGSKRRLVNFIKKTLELNSLHPQVYVESFVGGGSVALQLLQNNQVDKIILRILTLG